MITIQELLNKKPLLFDGGMGTELQKRGLTKCDKCESLMNEFGYQSYNFDLFCHKKGFFNKHLHVCLKCGDEMFGWVEDL